MTKKDQLMLSYLTPCKDYLSDTYFLHTYFKNKEDLMYSRLERVTEWVNKNGGKLIKLSGKKIVREQKGFIVRIIFPCFNKRDMKNIMSTLFYN